MRIRTVTTDYHKNLFLQESEEFIATEVGCNQVVAIYPELTYQTIRGFGGAFTESSGYNFSKLSKEKKEIVLNAYFGKDGIHYTLGRTHINSCDFSLSNYAYLNKDEDIDQKFNRDRDREYIVPMIKAAIECSDDNISFLASPWSPPSFMKTNLDMNHGGELKEEYKRDWAKYIVTYIKDCKKDGITISMLTVQNEPEATQVWDSCRYSAAQEMEFVRDYLGPILAEEGLSDVKIYVWDHNKELLYERSKAILSNTKAREYISGVAFHWYTGDHFEALDLVREQFPEQELLFTEGCVEYGRFFDSSEVWKAEMYAHDILGNLNHGMHGYMDWNLLLDEKGGPNHVGNFCQAPIMCNVEEDSIQFNLSYYYIGQFSKYIMPGAKRIAYTKYTDLVEVAAFINPNKERVVVLLNKSEKEVSVVLKENGIGREVKVNSHSIVTVLFTEE